MTTDVATNTDLEDKTSDEVKMTLKERIVSELKFIAGLIAFLLVFWTTIFGHFKIPSESMQPTLEVGDHLYVSKFAYGFSKHSLPVGLHHLPVPEGRIFSRLPKRGDVAVFRHPYQKIVMIKRVVGLPGDTVRVDRGRLYINDKVIKRDPVEERLYTTYKDKADVKVAVFEEQFDEEEDSHLIYERTDRGTFDNTGKHTIPADTVFFMGDNRDGSSDSRAPFGEQFGMRSGPGYVHVDYLIGRADLIMFSRYKCKERAGFHCAKKRFFSKIK